MALAWLRADKVNQEPLSNFAGRDNGNLAGPTANVEARAPPRPASHAEQHITAEPEADQAGHHGLNHELLHATGTGAGAGSSAPFSSASSAASSESDVPAAA